jgi:hypothetical protein
MHQDQRDPWDLKVHPERLALRQQTAFFDWRTNFGKRQLAKEIEQQPISAWAWHYLQR